MQRNSVARPRSASDPASKTFLKATDMDLSRVDLLKIRVQHVCIRVHLHETHLHHPVEGVLVGVK